MKTALLPATRVDPSLRRALEAALEKGETVSAFITASVRRQVQLREAQRAFLARGLAAERATESSGDWLEAEEVVEEVSALAAKLSTPRRRRK